MWTVSPACVGPGRDDARAESQASVCSGLACHPIPYVRGPVAEAGAGEHLVQRGQVHARGRSNTTPLTGKQSA